MNRIGRSRPIELARAAWGAGLLLTPRAVLTSVHHLPIDEKSLVVARILGTRQLAQAMLSGIRPSPQMLAMGVWVDLAHASSALGLAAADRSRARGGLTDAAVATLWALAGYRDLTRATATPPEHDRRRDRLARMVLGVAPGGRILLAQVATDRRRNPSHEGDRHA